MKRCGYLLLCLFMLAFTACGQAPTKEPIRTTQTTLTPITSTSVLETTDMAVVETTTTAEGSTSESASSKSSETATTKTTKKTSKSTTTGTVSSTTQASLVTISGEMRATWVSYIELDGLFKSCSTAEQARQAIDGILNTVEEFKLNTVFFHVRANSDAYYKSSYFKPASSVRKLINAGFDPLGYAVEAAHKRGIAIHAWVNPYRAGKNTAYLVNGIPTLTDADDRYYYVPTSVAAQQLILNGVREIVNNYAVDGIQYDDYFYPSGVLGETTVYGYESADYEAYQKSGGKLLVADWRRAAVDSLIAGTHTITKAKNRIFGVSPAVNAKNTYDKLYANPKKWISESGYVDYICPQIYTGFEHSGSAFDKMTDEWLSYPRHASVKLYVGIANYKAGKYSDDYAGTGKTEWATNSDIIKRSVLYVRSKQIPGMAFYSYSYLKPDQVAGLSKTNDVAIACKEMENLLTVL